MQGILLFHVKQIGFEVWEGLGTLSGAVALEMQPVNASCVITSIRRKPVMSAAGFHWRCAL